MEPVGGNVMKAQVVYYLNRNGKMEPPHMIEVPYLSNEGLRLIDVKRKLTVLRGSAMRNMFSWSYKRSYKNKYIWLDLSEEEVIVPGSSGEYVLKGSELFDDCQDKMMKYDVSSQESDSCKHPEVLQNKYRGAETWLKHDVPKSSSDQCKPSSLKHEVTEKCIGFSQGNLNEVRNGSHKKSFLTDSMQTLRRRGLNGLPAPDDFLVDNKISSSSELSDSSTKPMTDIRIFPIKSTIVPARHGCTDAATQTNLDNGTCYEALPKKDNEITGSSKPWKVFNNERSALNQNQGEASILSMISGELTSDQNLSHKKKHCKTVDACLLQDKDSSANLRLKHTTASRVFLQLLSCGGVDTKVQQEMADAEKEGRATEKKSDHREQLSGLLRSESPPSKKAIDKPVIPRGHQSLQNLEFRRGTPTAYFCELKLDDGNNHESFVNTIPQISEIDEEIVTALPSPSNEADLSKLVRRCSSFSSSW